MKEEMVIMLLQIQTQFRILHWQTTSEARHVAYGNIYGDLNENIDEFVEIFMGKYGRFELKEEGSTITIYNIKKLEINSFLKSCTEFLKSFSTELSQEDDTDLLNIRDEMLGSVNKLKYLLTQK